ncbi:hypothetical protein GGR51DRAFT_534402 [Nemania sp. FL0031]|nr:hypothetical protein GGR51DRAFT_534402 [Nemania sp. FL0031]
MTSSNDPTSEKHYFAFGSNMHLEQMAKRCPRSKLRGKGRLRGYKWQINKRGVANIVEGDPRDFVEGLLFAVTDPDIVTLDRNEGVSKGLYNKEKRRIECEPLSINVPATVKENITATAEWLKEQTPSTRRTEQESGESHSSRPYSISALVYISDRIEPGRIRQEYVARMKSAMLDAQKLGVSKTYLDTCLNPLVSARDEEIASARRAAVEHGESLSGQHLAPAGRVGGVREEENRPRQRRREVDYTPREHRQGHRRGHRGGEGREHRGYHNDRLTDPRDSQNAPRQREARMRTRGSDIDLRDDSDSTRSSYYGRDEVDSSWFGSLQWGTWGCDIL